MKKGQLTLFIIIGLLIIIAGGLLLYAASREAEIPFEEKVIVPAKIKPIYDHVKDCLDATAKQGLVRQGLQGGLIDIPGTISKNPLSRIALDPEGMIVIPYWYYQGEDRTPPLSEMERQLSVFIRDNIGGCIDFSQFKANVRAIDDPTPIVKFTENDVVVRLQWPLEITHPDQQVQIWEEFVAQQDVPMRHMWEVADNVMKFENSNAWMENLTMDFVISDPEVPTDGFAFECGTKRWFLYDIQERMKNVLTANLPTVRLKNTDHLPFFSRLGAYQNVRRQYNEMQKSLMRRDKFIKPSNVPTDSYEYFRMTMDAGIEPTSLKASFIYRPEFGLELNVQPRDGRVLKSNQMKGQKMMRFVCANQWHFAYDIRYPLLMQVTAPEALEGNGFIFQMAFPVLVKNNQPSRESYSPRKFDFTPVSTDYCDSIGEKTAEIRAKGDMPGMMFATELKDADIIMKCVNQECHLGKTRSDEGVYRLRTYLPECANPTITASKEGYLENSGILTGNRLDIPLKKLRTMTYDVVKHDYYLGEEKLDERERDLKRKDTATIRLFVKGTEFEQYKTFPSEDTINIVDGTADYELIIYLNDATGNVIGGYQAENITITADELGDAEHITFHVFAATPAPSRDEDKAKSLMYLYEGNYTKELKPTFR